MEGALRNSIVIGRLQCNMILYLSLHNSITSLSRLNNFSCMKKFSWCVIPHLPCGNRSHIQYVLSRTGVQRSVSQFPLLTPLSHPNFFKNHTYPLPPSEASTIIAMNALEVLLLTAILTFIAKACFSLVAQTEVPKPPTRTRRRLRKPRKRAARRKSPESSDSNSSVAPSLAIPLEPINTGRSTNSSWGSSSNAPDDCENSCAVSEKLECGMESRIEGWSSGSEASVPGLVPARKSNRTRLMVQKANLFGKYEVGKEQEIANPDVRSGERTKRLSNAEVVRLRRAVFSILDEVVNSSDESVSSWYSTESECESMSSPWVDDTASWCYVLHSGLVALVRRTMWIPSGLHVGHSRLSGRVNAQVLYWPNLS